MDKLHHWLQRFHTLPQADAALLGSSLSPVHFPKNFLLCRPGQVQQHLYFVLHGVQYSYSEGEHKNHIIAFTYPPGVCAIPDSFSFQKPSEFFLKCLTDSSFLAISYDQLNELFDQSQPLERLFRKMTEAMLAGIITRHVELHSLSIEERFRVFCNRSPHLLTLVPQKLLASYLGMDATNFSKLFNSVKI